MPDWKSLIRGRLAPARLAPAVETDVVEELAQHVDDRYRELRAMGVSDAEATDTALRELDGPERLLIELARTPRAPILDLPPAETRSTGHWLRAIWFDLRHAVRSIRLAPGFALTVVMTMALTIGPTTAIVSVGNWLLWRPADGVREPDRLAQVHFGNWRGAGYALSPTWVSYLNLADLQAAAKTIESFAGAQESDVSLAVDGHVPRRVQSSHVTANFFELLGVRMEAGRAFTADEDRYPTGAAVVVVGHRLARTMFGAAEAVGRTVHLNGRPMSIVGVAQPGFVGTAPTSQVDVWYPGASYHYVNHSQRAAGPVKRDDGIFYTFVMRLAPGATFEQAQAELDVLAPTLAERYPDENAAFKTVRARVFPALGLMPGLRPGYERTVNRLLGVAAVLVLLGCANVANLLLFRAGRERHMLAIRQALGASRHRLMQLQLLRSVVLAVAGASLGVAIAAILKEGIQNLLAPDSLLTAAAIDVPLDRSVLLITLLTAVVCAVLAGILPSWLSTRRQLTSQVLHVRAASFAHAPRVRMGFAAVQLALSMTLLVGALLTAATMRNLRGVDLGFETHELSEVYLQPGSHGYTPARARVYHEQLLAALEAQPSFTAVTLARRPPFSSSSSTAIRPPGGGEPLRVRYNPVGARYFDVLGIPIIHGRAFTPDEVRATPAAVPPGIVSASLAHLLFGTTDVLGRTVTIPPARSFAALDVVIVGVSGDIRWRNVDGELTPMLYLPFGQESLELMYSTVIVKSPQSLPRVTELVQAHAARIDSSMALPPAVSLQASVDGVLADQRLLAYTCALLGLIGCVLAGLGVFGLSAQSVIERTREFGIRLAIGATRGHVVRLVLTQAAWVIAIGGVSGLIGAAFASQLIKARLFGVDALEPRVYALALLALAMVVLVASAWPARNATRVQPVDVLRAE